MVVAGGCDFYPGSATSSPGFSFSVSDLRVAGEGDLLARIERLRKQLDAEGLLAPQKLLARPLLPRTIGVVTAETGKAREDILAGLARRGWAGRVVWGFAPVQDRHAAPLIARALTDLAAVGDVDVAIVARGGGSLADLLCFCDEALCRTVALLARARDRLGRPSHRPHAARRRRGGQLLDSHPRRRGRRRPGLRPRARRAGGDGHAHARAWPSRGALARTHADDALARAAAHVERQRARLHQRLREVRAGSRRRVQGEQSPDQRRAIVLERKACSTVRDCRTLAALRSLQRLALALAGHDPQRTLERGYALVAVSGGEPIATAAAARAAREVGLRFADDTTRCEDAGPSDERAAEPRQRESATRNGVPGHNRCAQARAAGTSRNLRPTRRRRRASRRSSGAWTPARPA